jgi:ketosteroid isomerase-like protein
MTLPGTGEIVIGPGAIEARMAESPAATAKWEWHPVYSEGAASGDLGFTIGEAVITPSGATPDKAFHSKYLTVWRRQPDGSVRYIVDGGNGR